jgi:hypothetical protein
MKKYLLLASVAALAFTSCSDQSTEFVGDEAAQKAREIAFAPIAKPVTRAAVQTAVFPTSNSIEVVAYQATATAGNYFGQTTFSKGDTYWEGGKYWPLSAATINFLGVTGTTNSSHVTFPTTASLVSSASVAYTSANSYLPTSQKDIMYAVGQGVVSQTGNTLSFPPKVDMTFYHALALINFQVAASSPTEVGAITINSIKLNGAQYTGTLAITNNAACTTTSAQVKPTAAWTPETAPTGASRPDVVNVPSSLTTTMAPATDDPWAAMMVIPSSFESFTINYTVTDGTTPHIYDYTYVPGGYDGGGDPIVTPLVEGTKYTYQITFKLHEILINPSVDPWDEDADGSGAAMPITIYP